MWHLFKVRSKRNLCDLHIAERAKPYKLDRMHVRNDHKKRLSFFVMAVFLSSVPAMAATYLINTFAGGGNSSSGFSGDGGNATAATLNAPNSVALDKLGNIYIADSINNRIRKVDSNGIITTFAGTGTQGYSGDGGNATSAKLSYPIALAFDSAGNLYVADIQNDVVRKVNTSGIISTFAGNGVKKFSGDGGPAAQASLTNPFGVACDSVGNLYIADSGNNTASGKVDTTRHHHHFRYGTEMQMVIFRRWRSGYSGHFFRSRRANI